MTQPKADPVRIKLYGMFTTKRRYVVQLIAAAVMMAFLLVAWLRFRHELRDQLRALKVPILDAAVAVWDLVPWIVAVLFVLQVLEACYAFRAFARKRAETPPPVVGSSGGQVVENSPTQPPTQPPSNPTT